MNTPIFGTDACKQSEMRPNRDRNAINFFGKGETQGKPEGSRGGAENAEEEVVKPLVDSTYGPRT
ncbi:MAG: hypothetical protein SFY80_17395 [Verrucomicrobiota bacterium]|nr:hypothetical protein [Verrucomicrobiota bacterium]